jgi:hypothetical protein
MVEENTIEGRVRKLARRSRNSGRTQRKEE